MHSKPTPRRMLRMTPYLITVGLGVSVVANAAESPAEEIQATDVAASEPAAEERKSEIPAPTIDTNGDGRPNLQDDNGDGKPD